MYERFEELRKLFGVTVAEICSATGIGKSTMSEWKKGKFRLKDDKRKAIAKYFGVSLAVIDGEEPIPEEVLNRHYSGKHHETFKVKPLFEVAAGQGRINSDYSDEYKEEEEMVDTDEYTWCKVCGDSMSPLLQDGDYVKIHLQTQTSPHDLTAIKVDGESVTIKYVEVVDNGVWLRAENKEVFEDKFYSVQEVLSLPITIIGKVVLSQRSY